ncbi:Iron permease FTR1/Fip1/EfeU [Fusarium oxysporum f. sp. vasinfectum]|nr:Iron permease FTR1/Fip1/EfeU [Fusarium oxysporum f. sp. vasinfectum]
MTVNVFAVPIFFICFRECLETSIIVSVLLAFLKQSVGGEDDKETYKRLLKQVLSPSSTSSSFQSNKESGMDWSFYSLGKDVFSKTEDIWEGSFSLIAAIIISIMGAALLRVNKLQEKWRVKLMQALDKKDAIATSGIMSRFKLWSEKHVMFILPFITVLREGLEAVVYIGGVSLGLPASSFPLAVICGLAAGCVVGYIIYRGGNTTSLQIFLIISTGFLYLVAAGLFSKAVWAFEIHAWNNIIGGDAAEVGSGPGSYDIHKSVWHVNCCNAELNGGGGWGIFNAILGWQNSATIGSVVSYNVYWLAVIICFCSMTYMERYGNLDCPEKPSSIENELMPSNGDDKTATPVVSSI